LKNIVVQLLLLPSAFYSPVAKKSGYRNRHKTSFTVIIMIVRTPETLVKEINPKYRFL